MNYIISEEELNNVLLQPIEEIARGMMDYDKKYHGFFVNGESLNDKLIKFNGKNIKIFVQKGSK